MPWLQKHGCRIMVLGSWIIRSWLQKRSLVSETYSSRIDILCKPQGAEARADPWLVTVRQVATGGKLESLILRTFPAYLYGNYRTILYISQNISGSAVPVLHSQVLTRCDPSLELPSSFAMWIADNVEELHKSLPKTRFFSRLVEVYRSL